MTIREWCGVRLTIGLIVRPIRDVARVLFAMSLLVTLVCASPASAATSPGGRSYEMVSPPNKNGGDVMGDPAKTRVAVDGHAVSYVSLTGFGDVVGSGIAFEYMGLRETDRWATHAITPAQDPSPFAYLLLAQGPVFLGEFSDDLSKGVFRALSPLTDASNVAQVRNLYVRTNLRASGTGSYELLNDSMGFIPPAVSPNTFQYRAFLAETSSDFTHVLFESVLNLTPDAPPYPAGCAGVLGNINQCPPRVYEWENGTVRLASILPDPDGSGPLSESPAESAGAGRGAQTGKYTRHTMSADGEKVFFSSPLAAGDLTEDTQLYMRLAHTKTVRVNASEKVPKDAQGGAIFWDATPDGSKVFFTTDEQLVNADVNSNADLYMYDTTLPDDANNLTLLSNSDVTGVIGTSEDGSYVYFVSDAQDIYVWHAGSLRHIGTVTSADAIDNIAIASLSLNLKRARVSRDGTLLLFQAKDGVGLTGYDHGQSCGAEGTSPCTELYIYNFDGNGGAGELRCASCNPSGAAATADASGVAQTGTGGTGSTQHLNRMLSKDGRWVFFTSGERLVPGDRNGAVRDVYAYDVKEARPQLVSTGRDSSDSFFMDASASGEDAFFITRERISSVDVDDNYDLYNARVGKGFPDPPRPPAPCSGDPCQGAPSPPAQDPSTGSPSLSGSTDVHGHATTPFLVIRPLGTRARRAWASSAQAVLRAQVSLPGTVNTVVRARIGKDVKTIASASRTVKHGGGLRLNLRLSPSARAHLRKQGRLRLSILTTYSRTSNIQRMRLTLVARPS